jgi:iron complex outermembrane receptor protein
MAVRRGFLGWLAGASLLSIGCSAHANTATVAPDLSKLSIEELGDIQVTSVSKRPEAIGQAPSAIYVITHDEIMRSGAASLPEMLRLAPNLEVQQTSASRYVITARGMNGAPAAQNFSNKLLVMIDGRSVYTPLFSGVYWDMQDVLPQDIDRIEVISGPGATLWGANAVNGVINIITRPSGDTQGGLIGITAGDREHDLSLRYGGRIGERLSYRVYAKTFYRDDTLTLAGAKARDHWSKPQAGVRLDWSPSDKDIVTLQGAAYHGAEAQAGAPAETIDGRSLRARWDRTLSEKSDLQLQAYYDHAERGQEVDGSGFKVDTFDVDVQHSFMIGDRNAVVWGGGYRLAHYSIAGTSTLLWQPPTGTLKLGNLFAQDSISLSNNLKLVLGLKVEDDPYVKAELLPNARLSWTPADGLTLWTAVSRAVRSPTPFDRDVVEKVNSSPFLIGGSNFRTEKLTAFETGARVLAAPRVSLAISTFWNDYDDLRSIEIAPGGFLPLRWGNAILAETYGVEAWGDYQVTDWWRLGASANVLEERFSFAPGASKILGANQAGNDPKYQAQLKSSMNLGEKVTIDAALRYASALPDPHVPAYTEINARLGWNITDKVQLALDGRNLLHDSHREYTDGNAIPRSVFLDLQWQF